MKVGIIGATGVLGREIVSAFSDSGDIRDEFLGNDPPLLLSSGQSAGETFQWLDDEELVVEVYSPDVVRGLDVALLAVPAPAVPAIAARLRELGITAVDASRTYRATAPLFFDEAPRPANLTGAPLVALPSAESLALARILVALEAFEPLSVRATILKAASGAGQAGVTDLAEGTGRLLNGQEPENPVHGHRLAFNLIPQAGAFVGADAEAELELARDLTKLLGRPIGSAATVAWAPWFFGDFLSITLRFSALVDLASVRGRLSDRAHLKLVDDPASTVYPMPALATGDDAVLVGRLRADPLDSHAIQLVAVMDGARASAAHAVEAFCAVSRARHAH